MQPACIGNSERPSLLFHALQESPKRLSTKLQAPFNHSSKRRSTTAPSAVQPQPQAPFNTASSAVQRKGAWVCGQRRLGLGEERSGAANGAWGRPAVLPNA